jgi:hypothetical protein
LTTRALLKEKVSWPNLFIVMRSHLCVYPDLSCAVFLTRLYVTSSEVAHFLKRGTLF